MGYQVAARPLFGKGAYQVVSPTAVAGGGGESPPGTFLAFALGRHIGNWR